MDSQRAREIMNSSHNIQVLYQGTPVWLENVSDENTAEVMFIDSREKESVPVYKLVEVNPVK